MTVVQVPTGAHRLREAHLPHKLRVVHGASC